MGQDRTKQEEMRDSLNNFGRIQAKELGALEEICGGGTGEVRTSSGRLKQTGWRGHSDEWHTRFTGTLGEAAKWKLVTPV